MRNTLFVLLALASITCIPGEAVAYDVCGDPGAPCTHERMTLAGLDLYLHVAGGDPAAHPVRQELAAYWLDIRDGVEAPDLRDPIYGNEGIADALVTITHFWSPDEALGAPMVTLGDEYPNALQAAQAAWSRALGEYASGNKAAAYEFLGMVAHYLGDQTVPAHVHNDTHPNNMFLIDTDDAFEEWMSISHVENPNLPNQSELTAAEWSTMQSEGLLDNPAYEIADQFLWLFLTTNQVADYFASDDEDGDANHPVDPRVAGWAAEALQQVADECDADPYGCPTSRADLEDNDEDGNNDDDLDLSRIRRLSYLRGVRALGTLFALWEQAVGGPILTLHVHRMEEIGTELGLGLDDLLAPDFYAGVYIGGRGSGPYAPYLMNDANEWRRLDGNFLPANLTRADALLDEDEGGTEDQTRVTPDYHFGQAYRLQPGAAGYTPGETVLWALSVWDQDISGITSPPYSTDDVADISPVPGQEVLEIEIDLAGCLSGAADAVTVLHVNESFPAGTRITMRGSGDPDPEDTEVEFSVTLARAAPVITCPPDVVVDSLPGECGTPVSFTVTATDAQDPLPPTVVCAPPSGSYFSVGTTTVTCVATDTAGLTDTCSFTVTVGDVEPPAITCGLQRALLYPATGGILPVGFSASASDLCDPNPTIRIDVYSDEPNGAAPFSPDGMGGGSTASLRVRAERAYPGDGRVYLVVVTAADAHGNKSVACRSVVVPLIPTAMHVMRARAAAMQAEAEVLSRGDGSPPAGYAQGIHAFTVAP